MQANEPRSTSATLLGRLRDVNDTQAWTEFYERYAPRIRGWCRQRRLDAADTDDLTQNVLLRVVTLIRSEWVYDPRQNFSGLLRTLWERAFSDWLRARTRLLDTAAGGGAGSDQLASLEVNDFLDWLRDFLQREELEEALARLEIDRPDDIPLLRAYLNGASADEIATAGGRTRAAVAMALSRAKKRLGEKLRELGSDLAREEGET